VDWFSPRAKPMGSVLDSSDSEVEDASFVSAHTMTVFWNSPDIPSSPLERLEIYSFTG
jgi:hypothetical protein